ncbi:hypothetical protein L3Q82_001394 [Scortum barcoo]|uniref:Uncharacterized protein n=1 Tax=Scortum barcoo TaxID=214431 RepID=A0ACB8W7T3_9TELE|nr:hypothetical protein L3Q82_001394 [Scortum barcoo]
MCSSSSSSSSSIPSAPPTLDAAAIRECSRCWSSVGRIGTSFSRVKSFELFLLGLAAANLEEILIVNIYDAVILQSSSPTAGTWLCRSLKFLTVLGEITSISFTVLISIFRYQKLRDADKRVNFPIYLDSIRSAWLVSGLSVMLSTLLSVPIFFMNIQGPAENVTRNKSACPPDFFQCSKNYCPTLNRFYKYLFIVVCNLVPFLIITVTSCLIISVLLNQRRMVTPVASMSGSSQFGRKSKSLRLQRSTMAVLAAMGLFQVDWTLYLIFQLTFSPTDLPFWAEMEFFISTSYTSISPYVYGIGNNLFSLKNCMKKMKRARGAPRQEVDEASRHEISTWSTKDGYVRVGFFPLPAQLSSARVGRCVSSVAWLSASICLMFEGFTADDDDSGDNNNNKKKNKQTNNNDDDDVQQLERERRYRAAAAGPRGVQATSKGEASDETCNFFFSSQLERGERAAFLSAVSNEVGPPNPPVMPATDSELTSMEDSRSVEDEKGSLTNIPSSVPPTTIPSSTPLAPTTTKPNFTSETVIETKAISMASTDCSSALSSPAEASPAKPAVTSPTTFDGRVETSPATSHIASASESLTCTGTSLVNISESSPSLPVSPSTTFGSPDVKNDFPAVLTFKGVSVTLENNSVWKQFHSCGTEMILTKQGRRMFPYCRYRLAGLDPERLYSLVLSIVPANQYRYRWSTSKWEVSGSAEHQAQSLIRAFSHHYSACRGSEWMAGLVSFYKLKLTNNSQDLDGHIILHSMHRYIPRLHVVPVPNGVVPTPYQPVIMGPECLTFTFPQTEFMAVTTYQNFRITQLKINHNPFAKGFREDGNNSRLHRVSAEAQPAVKTDTQPSASKPADCTENTKKEEKEEAVDLSTKNHPVSASRSNAQETRLVLKPIMSSPATKDEPYVPCIRGKHALGELVLVKNPPVDPKTETDNVCVTPKVQRGLKVRPKAIPVTPTSPESTPGSSPGYRKRRKRMNRRWANSRGKDLKAAAAASPTVVHSPSLTAVMQPELDDVEGLLFVSFTSKEALEVHVRDKPASSSLPSPVSPTTPTHSKPTVEVTPETDEEKIARVEAILLQDLRVLRHRQVIHPVLQEVGLKLSSLDPTKPIDLQYLGIHLPLPPPHIPEQGDAAALSPGGSQKNLSAFCSNMLDEYLESEAQYITERAAAFSTDPEGSVAYQLPAKSSSYVKTLDSVLKQRNGASKFPVGAHRPCPLSHKPLLYSALTSPAPPLSRAASSVQAAAQSIQKSPSAQKQPGAANSVSPRSSTCHTGVSQRATVSCGQSQGTTFRPSGLSKHQFKLLQMEIGAQNQGLSRTQLTRGRLSVALSVILTKQTLPSQVLKVSQYPKCKVGGSACGQDFCRLGCVCSSLQHLNSGPLHCRRPDCMFACACFKRKITKQMSEGESEQHIQPVYCMTNTEHAVQPGPGSHAKKLWNRNIHAVDPEPIFAPKSAPPCLAPPKVVKRSSVARPVQPIREEDKDPVYKYLESMMTCARVREFNSKPPPEVTIETKSPATFIPNTTANPQRMPTDDMPKKYRSAMLTVKKSEKTSQGTTSDEIGARKQIEIQSACQWGKDRKMVLEALCRRMNQNRLSRRFCIGPYCIRPVAKIFMRKPSGSIVTYRVHISKPSKASDNDEDDFDDSEEEKHSDKSLDEDTDPGEEDGQIEEPEVKFGVTPFLSGVLPAGKLKARTKSAGCQAYGLIQVNGKSYNQARLLLGNMGSLHPANRLAAYVTGRLHGPFNVSHKNSSKSETINKINTPGPRNLKAAGTVAPQIVTAGKTTDLKTPTQPSVQPCQPDPQRLTLPQHSQNSSDNPVQTFVSSQRSSSSAFQSSSVSSPVSLTVSPSLKTPSFLGQSGTYSFRICPPANQGAEGQNRNGVTLPGGFTLIQLPKPGADGVKQESESANTTNVPHMDKVQPQKNALFNFSQLLADSDANWLGLDTFTGVKDLLGRTSAEAGSSPELMCDEKMPPDESDETSSRLMGSNLDMTLGDLSSDSSDYCGEGDEDEEDVDIETVEEVQQRMAITKMKEAVRMSLMESRDSIDHFVSARKLSAQDQMEIKCEESKDKKRRKNHTVLERQRRSEQRTLFDKLQTVLQSDPRAPRLRLLALALKEIQNLVETCKRLEEKKRRLTRMQSVYVKELSLLSGKSDSLIKHKLKQICDRQKLREKTVKSRPFFSHLLQSRAALLQTTTHQSEQQQQQPTPLLQPDSYMAPSQTHPHMTPAQSSLQQTPAPQSPPQAVTAPSSQTENEPVAGVNRGQHQPKFEGQMERLPQSPSVSDPLQVSAAQDGASPVTSTPTSNNPSASPTQPFTLPLIRSKTGRIILPSCLKPIGQGFYTLMLMNTKQNGEEGDVSSSANVQPSDVNQEKSFSEPDHPLDSESSPILEDKTAQSSKSKPKCSVAEAGSEGTPLPSDGENKKRRVVEDTSKSVGKSETSLVDEERQSEKRNSEMTPAAESTGAVSAAVTRRRGRPPRKKSAPLWSPPVMRRGRSSSKSNEDGPVRLSRSFRSPNTKPKQSPAQTTLLRAGNTSRPLTRGALGKDFPSAKKRSWIDLEKELEPELESE